ncbi:MAG: hypothetical protein ACFE7R_10300 [Candidatus Hodarchaeota archaeon]
MQYPNILRYTFLIHIIIAFVFAVMFFLIPTVYIDLVVWPFADLAAARRIGALFFGLGIAAILGYRAKTWEQVEIVVYLNITWTIFGIIGLVWSFIENSAYPMMAYWLNVAISALLFLLYLVSYLQART